MMNAITRNYQVDKQKGDFLRLGSVGDYILAHIKKHSLLKWIKI